MNFEVKYLKEASTGKTLFMKNKDKFKPNAVYTIEQPKGNILSEVSFYLRIVLFLCTDLFNTASSATPQIQLCQRMLGLNSGLLRIWHWQSDALATGLDLNLKHFWY